MSQHAFDPCSLSARPIVAAPMGGGPTTPDLVVAVVEAGGLGFLAAAYKSVEAMSTEIADVRTRSGAGFGVNVFVPQPRADPAVVGRYLETLAVDAARLNTALGQP